MLKVLSFFSYICTCCKDFGNLNFIPCVCFFQFLLGLAAGLGMGALSEVTKKSLGLKKEGN